MHIEGSGKGGGGGFKQTPDSLRSNDTMEALMGVCAGPIVGPTRGLKSIKIDGTPIEDESGSANFKDFTALVADGDPAKFPQIVKMQLGGGASPVPVGLSLTNTNTSGPGPWITKSIANVGADALDLRFIVQQLLRQDKTGIFGTVANLEIQLKPSGTINWINPVTSGVPTGTYSQTGSPVNIFGATLNAYIPRGYYGGSGAWLGPTSSYFPINGKTTSPYVWELRITVPNTGNYLGTSWDVRARLIEKETVEADPITEKRTISWESVSAVYSDPIGDAAGWRGLSWLYLFGKASDQLTGVPEISGEWDTKIVSVPGSAVYNPATRIYTGAIWDGSYAKAFTSDPAWCINDLLSDALFGVSAIASGSYLNKWDALEASKWFSQYVPNGAGGVEPRYAMNITVDSPQRVDELVQNLAGAVGGIAWDSGNGEWRMKVDKPEMPVDIFTLETIEGDFHYSHTDTDTWFNDITVAFLNKEFEYRQDRVHIFDQAHIDLYGRKPTSIVAMGCTSRQEAARRGLLRLRTAINEKRLVNFVTNRRGRMVRPLDTILVADTSLGYLLPDGLSAANPSDGDVTNNRTTGRLVAWDSGLKKITLRDTVRLEIGASYTLSFTSPNHNYNPDSQVSDRNKPTLVTTVNVVNSSVQRGDVRDIYIDVVLPVDRPEYLAVAISASGLPSMPKAYRILGIKPHEDGERIAISAIEIDSGKWDASDNVDLAAIAAQTVDVTTPPPLPPTDGQILRLTTLGDKRQLSVNWTRPGSLFISGFRVGYSLNNSPVLIIADNIQDTSVDLINPTNGLYTFYIWSVDRRGQVSKPLSESATLDDIGLTIILGNANRVKLSRFESGTTGWTSVVNPNGIAGVVTTGITTGRTFVELPFTATATAQQVGVGQPVSFGCVVTPGERLSIQSGIESTGPVASTWLRLTWLDGSGNNIGQIEVDAKSGAQTFNTKFRAFADVPVGAVFARLQALVLTSAAGAGVVRLYEPMITQAATGQTIHPSFSAGPNSEDGATRGAPAGTLVAGVLAENLAAASSNFNTNNDRNGTTPTAPVIPADGTSVDHVLNTDGSIDLSFEWQFTGSTDITSAANIDGFHIVLRAGLSNTPYTFGTTPAEETIFVVPPSVRAIVFPGIASNKYYTVAVRTYRDVDTDIAATGLLTSAYIKPSLASEDPYLPQTSVVFAGDVTGTIDGSSASAVATGAAEGSSAYSGTISYRSPGAPTNNPIPSGITITNNTNATRNIQLNWAAYTDGALKADFLILYWKKGTTAPTVTDSSIMFKVNTTGSAYFIFEGVNPADPFSFGIAAARKTDVGIEVGTIQAPASAPQWVNVATGTPNYTANIAGTSATTLVAQVLTVSAMATNYNANNDRNSTTPTSPSILTDGTSVDHTINTDSSANISFEWQYTYSSTASAAGNIDGFLIYVYSSTAATAYTFGTDPANETRYFVPYDVRAFVLPSVAANRYYTLGVQAYRVVDSDISSTGYKLSPVIRPGLAGENPYQPTSNVVFNGDIQGTIQGTGSVSVAAGANAANNGLNTDGSVKGGKVDYTAIVDNSVTRAFTFSSGLTKIGNGAYQTISTGTVTLSNSGVLFVLFTAKQNYDSGLKNWVCRIKINGSIVSTVSGGGGFTDAVSLSGSAAVGVGAHTVAVEWYVQDYTVQLLSDTTFAMGAQK